MAPQNPEDICRVFQQFMRDGNIDGVLSVYEGEVAFRNASGRIRRGIDELKEELAPFAASKAVFDFTVTRVIEAGDIALMQTDWTISPQQLNVSAIEVARRQPDGTWRWLIGDPFR
jgi:ketosteroid isomerase-like protein